MSGSWLSLDFDLLQLLCLKRQFEETLISPVVIYRTTVNIFSSSGHISFLCVSAFFCFVRHCILNSTWSL